MIVSSFYLFIESLLRGISNGATSLIQGLSLGLLSNDALERLTEHRYATSFSSYAEESYVNSGFFTWEREAILRYFPPGGRVLVAAAGAGREMIALARAGFGVEGFDCCAPLVEAGRNELKKQGIDAKLEYAPPSTVPEVAGHYDAILVGFSGYMYIVGRKRRIDFLRVLCRFLNPGAPLMLSFTEGSYGRRRVWTAMIGTAVRRLRLAKPVEEGDWVKTGFQHHFVREQIVSEMSEAGMHLAYYSGGTCYGHAVGLVRNAEVIA
jgi:2-polyprenyl-3-methyl-5-hydroxy-6-metoxy-1,4-benzoquinol methylase